MTQIEKAKKRIEALRGMTKTALKALAADKEAGQVKGYSRMEPEDLIRAIMVREEYDVDMEDGDTILVEYIDGDTEIGAENTPAPAATEPTSDTPAADETDKIEKFVAKKPEKWVKLTTKHDVIGRMKAEEADVTECPLRKDGKPCQREKDPKKLICKHDYRKPFGRKAVEIVQKDIEEYVPKDTFWYGVKEAKSLINLKKDGPDEIKALPDYLKSRPVDPDNPDFVDLSGVHINMLRKMVGVAKRKLEDQATAKAKSEKDADKAMAKKEQNDARMAYTVNEIVADCPAPGFPRPEDYFGKLEHEGRKITDGMIKAACDKIWNGDNDLGLELRWRDWGKTARELCDLGVEAEFPKKNDPYGKRLQENLDFFTKEIIAERGLNHLNKDVTPKMMRSACVAEAKQRKRSMWASRDAKPSRDDVDALEGIEGVSYNGSTAKEQRR